MEDYTQGSEQVSLFCRLNMNIKRQLPIRASEVGLLIYIVKSEEKKTPIEIATFFKVTKPMVTTMINNLIKKEYLIKIPSEKDRRSFTLVPTKKAICLVEETYEEYFKTMAYLRNEMGVEDYQELMNLLQKANTILLKLKSAEE